MSNIVGKSTTGFRKVATDANLDRPTWSPDGARIAYADRRGLSVIDANGGAATQIFASGVRNPAWSPDGSKIACVVENDTSGAIAFLPSDGGQVEVPPITGIWGPAHPAWSPDGSRIAFDQGDLFSSICVAPVTGGESRQIASGPSHKMAPVWSAVEPVIVYAVQDEPDWGLWKCPDDGGEQTQLLRAHAWCPSLSPDGTRIVFVAQDDSGTELQIVSLTGGAVIPVPLPDSPQAQNPRAVAWSPDGARIAYVSDSGVIWIIALSEPVLRVE